MVSEVHVSLRVTAYAGLQSNRVDQDKDYVEVVDDESGAKDRRGQPAKLRRYKDDAYRSTLTRWFI